ncbi:MAG: uncharacterized protein KVP18_003953 [Porospora cf. gigantea A]|uniref:uncharacterized protein n=1 Tax=Porospora cf. gigantea A TaxID=2853593 RepID=UPI003559BE3D|nr:MAG: hypothetical protein KVP18_003953 [Porospora cf. gigantea A]
MSHPTESYKATDAANVVIPTSLHTGVSQHESNMTAPAAATYTAHSRHGSSLIPVTTAYNAHSRHGSNLVTTAASRSFVSATTGYAGGVTSTMGSYTLPPGAVEQSSRKLSSTIIGEEFLGTIPKPDVRYVDVNTYEEVVTRVPKKEVRHVEKRVPKIEVQYVDKEVMVPEIQYVEKVVEVPRYEEVVKHVAKVQVVDRPYDVIKEVPRIETKVVERVVEVPEVIEVPKPYAVEQKVYAPRFQDSDQAVIVAQSVHPVIADCQQTVEVDAVELVPETHHVDIHVGKLVNVQLIQSGARETHHRVVQTSAAEYNSMLKFLNAHLHTQEVQNLPFLQESGQIPFMAEQMSWQELSHEHRSRVHGYTRGGVYVVGGTRINDMRNLTTTYVSGEAYKSKRGVASRSYAATQYAQNHSASAHQTYATGAAALGAHQTYTTDPSGLVAHQTYASASGIEYAAGASAHAASASDVYAQEVY